MNRASILLLCLAVECFGANALTLRRLDTQPIARSGIPVDFYLSFESGSANDAITTTILNNSTYTANAGTWNIYRTNGEVPLLYSKVLGTNYQRSPITLNNVYYETDGSRGMYFILPSVSSTTFETLRWSVPITLDTSNVCASVNTVFQEGVDCQQDQLVIWNTGNAKWATMQGIKSGASRYFRVHGSYESASTYGNPVYVSSNVIYNINVKLDYENQKAKGVVINAATREVVGCTSCNTDRGKFSALTLQSYLTFNGGTNFYDNLVAAWDDKATLPLELFTVPAPTINYAFQVASNTTYLRYVPVGFHHAIELSTNAGGSYTELTNTYTSTNYTDAACVDGYTNIYRISTTVEDTVSPYSSTKSIIINNALADLTVPETPLLQEVLEETGYYAGAWNEAIGSGGVADEDYTTETLCGNQSLYVSRAAYTTTRAYKSYTASGTVYCRFKFKFKTRVDSIPFFAITDASLNALASLSVVSGKLRISILGAAGSDTTETFSDNTTCWIWMRYTKGTGADAVAEAWFSPVCAKPATDSGFYCTKTDGTATANASIVYCGQSGAAAAGATAAIYDNIYVSTTDF